MRSRRDDRWLRRCSRCGAAAPARPRRSTAAATRTRRCPVRDGTADRRRRSRAPSAAGRGAGWSPTSEARWRRDGARAPRREAASRPTAAQPERRRRRRRPRTADAAAQPARRTAGASRRGRADFSRRRRRRARPRPADVTPRQPTVAGSARRGRSLQAPVLGPQRLLRLDVLPGRPGCSPPGTPARTAARRSGRRIRCSARVDRVDLRRPSRSPGSGTRARRHRS